MKKNVTTTLAFVFLLAHSWAQTSYGIKAGLNLSEMGNYQLSENDHLRPGFNSGLFAKINLSRSFFIQPEITYSKKGFRSSWPAFDESGTVNLNYISVPVLAGLRLSNKVNILAGPEFSYLVDATSDYGDKGNFANSHDRFDLGVDFGIAYNINRRIGIDLQYSYGFALVNGPVTASPYLEPAYIRKGSNQVLQINLSYIFPRK